MGQSLDWTRVETLFEQALELPEVERKIFLQRQCAGQPGLYDEVYSLVLSHGSMPAPEVDSLLSSAVAVGVQQWAADSKSRTFGDGSRTADRGNHHVEALVARLEQAQPDLVIQAKLSQGGTGVVFLAKQRSLNRDVAVKVLHEYKADTNVRERFLQESRASANIKNDHVVEIYSVSDSPDIAYLVMEYIPGPSLKELIDSSVQVTPRLAAAIAQQIASGLMAAHENHLIHRDIKPANIILAGFEQDAVPASVKKVRAKLIDFGIVRDMRSQEHLTMDGSILGTPAYMSREQLFDPDTVDARSDIYGLGVTLYEMLTGTLPFRGAPHIVMRQIELAEPVAPRKLDDRIPRDLESICLKAISRSPAHRYQSAAEFREDLGRFLEGSPTSARPVPFASKCLGWCRRNRGMAASIGLGLLLVLAVVSGSLAFAWTMAAKEREITRQKSATLESRIQAVIDAHPGHLLDAIANADLGDPAAADRFKAILAADEHGTNRKVNAAIALASIDSFHTELIIDRMDDLYVSSDVCQNLLFALKRDSSAVRLLTESLAAAQRPEQQARRIILLAHLGQWEAWQAAARRLADPTVRTAIIHQYKNWHGDLNSLAPVIEIHKHEDWSWTLCAALCEIDRRSLDQPTSQALFDALSRLDDARPYATYHFAQLAIRNITPDKFEALAFQHPDCRSFAGDFHLIRLGPTRTRLGRFDTSRFEQDHPPRTVQFTRAIFVSDTEVSVEQFAEFALDEWGVESYEQWIESGAVDTQVSPNRQHPMQQVSWRDAVKFCNWLSRKNGFRPAYRLVEGQPAETPANASANEPQDSAEPVSNRWQLDQHANGFRLLTDAEWEFASRNHSQTIYFFGSDAKYFSTYGIGSSGRASQATPIRGLRPNSLGLYGMLGNVWEWVHNRFEPETFGEHEVLVDPFGPDEFTPGLDGRVYQGAELTRLTEESTRRAAGMLRPMSNTATWDSGLRCQRTNGYSFARPGIGTQ